MIRAAIYCRLSDEDRNKKNKKDESESIQNQKSLLMEYCRNQGWQIQDIYCDEDMSGADRTRPEFNRMIVDCKEGKIDVVLCKTQSRFSRDIETVEHYIHGKFSEWGVRFVGILDHADTEDIRNKKSRQINGLINEWYLEDLSINVKKTLRHKKEQGIYTGSFAPYGYKLDKEQKGKLFIDPSAAEVVRMIYSMYESGAGYVKIAKELNLQKIPNPYEYKRQNGSKFKTHGDSLTAKIWNEAEIRNILKNEVYAGTLVQGKTETVSYKSKKRRKISESDYIKIKNAHEPIIEINRWNEINAKISKRKRAQLSGERHIFSGKIFCAECGSSMWKMSYKLRDGRYEYFKCKSTKCADTCSNKKSIKLDVVQEIVNSQIQQLFKKYYDAAAIDVSQLSRIKEKDVENAKKQLNERILKQKLNIKQLYKDKLNGIIDNEIFCSVYKEMEEEISAAEAQIAKLSQKEKMPDIKGLVREFAENITADEYTVHKLIDKILISQACADKRVITIRFNV